MRSPRRRLLSLVLVSFLFLAGLLVLMGVSPGQEARAQTVPPTPTPTATPGHGPRPTPRPTAQPRPRPTAEPEEEDEQESAAPVQPGQPSVTSMLLPAMASQPMTVTVVGADDPAALSRFLRHLLAGYGPAGGYLTVTIGALPADFPISLTLPGEVDVIGGYVQRGEFEQNLLLLAGSGTPEALADAVRQEFLAQGYTVPANNAAMGSQVFLPSDPLMPEFLCSPDRRYVVFQSVSSLADEPAVMRLNISRSSPGDICTQGPVPYQSVTTGILPQLAPPPNAQVRSSGGGGGGTMVSADAEVQTVLTAEELAAHYNAQLVAAGWEQLDASSANAIAWSAWRLSDANGNPWTATFYIVQKGDSPNTFLMTLRADAQPSGLGVEPEGTAPAGAQATQQTEAAVEYYYTQSEGAFLATLALSDAERLTALVPQARQFWSGTDGSGRIQQQAGAPLFFSEAERAAWEAAGAPQMGSSMDETFAPGSLSLPPEYADLPSDVAALTQQVQQIAGATGNPLSWQMFTVVGDLLREQPRSLEVRQALYQVSSAIEGVEIAQQAEDRQGRPALALSYSGTMNKTTTHRTLFLDPQTYALLGEEEILLGPSPWVSAQPGETIGWVSYITMGTVDSTEAVVLE